MAARVGTPASAIDPSSVPTRLQPPSSTSLWSDPPQMYVARGTTTLPDEEVPWSELLDDPRLLAALRTALDG